MKNKLVDFLRIDGCLGLMLSLGRSVDGWLLWIAKIGEMIQLH